MHEDGKENIINWRLAGAIYLKETKKTGGREDSNRHRLGLLLVLNWGTVPATPISTNENTRNGHGLLEIADLVCHSASEASAERTVRSG